MPHVYPCNILNQGAPLLTHKCSIITITPSPLQVEQCEKKWSQFVDHVKAVPASPYGPWEDLEHAARMVKDMDGDLVVLDCIGFTQEMKNMFARETGKLVVLPRTLLARVISELTDVE